MGKLKDRLAKLVGAPASSKAKPVPQKAVASTRAFTDSAENGALPTSRPDRCHMKISLAKHMHELLIKLMTPYHPPAAAC